MSETMTTVPEEVREAAEMLVRKYVGDSEYNLDHLLHDHETFRAWTCEAFCSKSLWLNASGWAEVLSATNTIQQWYDRDTLQLFWHHNTLLYGNPDEPEKAREVGAVTEHQGYFRWTGKYIQNGVCQNHNAYGKYSDRAAAMKHCEEFARKSLNLPEVSP
jgi:hypothetical protein